MSKVFKQTPLVKTRETDIKHVCSRLTDVIDDAKLRSPPTLGLSLTERLLRS